MYKSFWISVASAAALIASPFALALPSESVNVSTPDGILHYHYDSHTLAVTVSGAHGVLSVVPGQAEANNHPPVHTPAGSAVLLSYNTGGNNDCPETYQWFSILPGGQYRHTPVFGHCYHPEHIHTQGNQVLFTQVSNMGKGNREVAYNIQSGTMQVVSSNLVGKNAPKIVVTSWHAFVPVYGTIEKTSAGYVLRFPQKVEITGSDSTPGNLYTNSIAIDKLEVPASDIGKPGHYLAQIAVPMAGPTINTIRPQ